MVDPFEPWVLGVAVASLLVHGIRRCGPGDPDLPRLELLRSERTAQEKIQILKEMRVHRDVYITLGLSLGGFMLASAMYIVSRKVQPEGHVFPLLFIPGAVLLTLSLGSLAMDGIDVKPLSRLLRHPPSSRMGHDRREGRGPVVRLDLVERIIRSRYTAREKAELLRHLPMNTLQRGILYCISGAACGMAGALIPAMPVESSIQDTDAWSLLLWGVFQIIAGGSLILFYLVDLRILWRRLETVPAETEPVCGEPPGDGEEGELLLDEAEGGEVLDLDRHTRPGPPW